MLFLVPWLINLRIWYDFSFFFSWLKIISREKKSWRRNTLLACVLTWKSQSTVLCRKPSVWTFANQAITLIFIIQSWHKWCTYDRVVGLHISNLNSHIIKLPVYWVDILPIFCNHLKIFKLVSQMNKFQLISFAFPCLPIPSFLQMVDGVSLPVDPWDVFMCAVSRHILMKSKGWNSHESYLLGSPKELTWSFEPEKTSFVNYILMSLQPYETWSISKASKLQK